MYFNSNYTLSKLQLLGS